MAKGFYIGANNVAHKGKKAYVGINNVARKVKKIYTGVNGVAKLAWNSEYTTAVSSSGTLPEGYKFYNSGTDVAVPYNGNSNILEIFTGILPENNKSYLYNIAENTLTETSKQASVDLWAYDGCASADGYMYFLSISNSKVYKMRQSDYALIGNASISLSTSYYLAEKCIIEFGDSIYFPIYYSTSDDKYRVYLYALNKSTLALTRADNSALTLSDTRNMGMVVHGGSLYVFYNSDDEGKYLYCYKFDPSDGGWDSAFYTNTSPFGSGFNVLRAMELDGETYLFAGSHYQMATKIYKVNYSAKTYTLFATLSEGVRVETWLHNGNGTVISTYDSASSANFTKLEFK